jgi:hypothetical protein
MLFSLSCLFYGDFEKNPISATDLSMKYLFCGKGYAAATKPRIQLNEWKAHASLTHVCSAAVVSMIYLFYIKGMQKQLGPGIS